jgi:hypothetical protein
MIVISPHAKRGYVSNTAFNASSYLKTVQTILGVQSLPCDPSGSDSVQTMDEMFDVPITPAKKGTTPAPGTGGNGTTSGTPDGGTTSGGATSTPAKGAATATPATGAATATPATGAATAAPASGT